MSHIEKDCANVPEEDKEAGCKWGLYIRPSPRKGLNKHKEVEEIIKMRKCLFVLKPKNSDDVGTLLNVGHTSMGDDGRVADKNVDRSLLLLRDVGNYDVGAPETVYDGDNLGVR